ncbi:hypothetical protein Hanom_Chr14g01259221 [Helianthus anomalus]
MHALRANPVICSNCINAFWNTKKIDTQGAGSIEATVQKTKIIISEAVIREVLRLGDQPHHPTLYDQARVQASLRRMSYEGGYPTVLKKLFPPYWRLLVHFFLQYIAENKGGWDQLNKTQTSVVVALVNEWDYNFSAFIFNNMKKMLDDLKKKIFMLYPRFIQMILDERYPTLVNGPNYINLKPMGPGCFENVCRNKRAKHHNLKQDMLLRNMGGLLTLFDTESGPDSSEETDSESKIEIVLSGKEEDIVRKPVPMTSDNLAALIRSLQGGDGDPTSISTSNIQETTDITEESAPKKQRTNTALDNTLSGPSTTFESTRTINPQPDPPTTDASKRTNLEDTDLCDFSFDF